ncbi:HAD family phosphatase [Candidatus Woesearchaeota archaeon]|nr:HAD family phosphatase [Candidatus Woesearchaeota archaeon]
MIKGIIFDMDGVLIDTNRLHYNRWNRLFKRYYNINLSEEEFAVNLGESSVAFADHFIKKYSLGIDTKTLLEKIRADNEEFKNNLKLKPGINEFIKKYKNEFKFALATGAQTSSGKKALKRFNLTDFFDYVVGGNDVSNSKPDPEIFLNAAENLGLNKEECIVIEDSQNGLTAAKRAGMKCIIIIDEFTAHHDFSKADFVLDSINELTIEKINSL